MHVKSNTNQKIQHKLENMADGYSEKILKVVKTGRHIDKGVKGTKTHLFQRENSATQYIQPEQLPIQNSTGTFLWINRTHHAYALWVGEHVLENIQSFK